MITVNGKVYDGVMMKPDLDDVLEHHGVKGMKWGFRKQKAKAVNSNGTRKKSKFDQWAARQAQKNINRSINKQKKKQAKRVAKGKPAVSPLQRKITERLAKKRWGDDIQVRY